MSRLRILGLVALLAFGAAAFATATHAIGSDDDFEGRRIALRDDCDPKDPAWDAVGGCNQRRGDVSFLEFVGELDSPLADAVVGHQAWQIDPQYVKTRVGRTLEVINQGGRPHTFTEVAQFGGGTAPNPALNEGLITSPECPGAELAAGDTATLSGLAPGNHRFICCIHPWMRALVKVEARGED